MEEITVGELIKCLEEYDKSTKIGMVVATGHTIVLKKDDMKYFLAEDQDLVENEIITNMIVFNTGF
jgi:hypothetical protein